MGNIAREPIAIPSLTADTPAREILAAGMEAAAGPVSLACSFSIEDVVVLDLAREAGLTIGVFALDTGRLPEETYQTAEAVTERFGIRIDWYFPDRDAVEKLEREKGLFSFRESLENRLECCRIRKVEPLGRALENLAGWVTGMRREQSQTRTAIMPLEIDAAHGNILKINPLVNWTEKAVWDYAETRRLPINRLHRQGYPSIGCAPCTRPVRQGDHPRSGRWWWEDPENKECGLHRK